MQAKELLEASLTTEVIGSTYPVAPLRGAAAQLMGVAQIAAGAGVLFGERLFEAAGLPAPPAWYVTHVASNRFGAGIAVWLGGNLLTNQLLATGAFEVYHDGALVRPVRVALQYHMMVPCT